MNTKRVDSEESLADAIGEGADFIEIEGDLAKKTFRIRAAGSVAWGVTIGAIGIATASVILAMKSGDGKSQAISGLSAAAFMAVPTVTVGYMAAAAAVAIAVSAGSAAVLTKLRSYKQVSFNDGVLVLSKT
jgi:hypothetical protein